MMDVTTEEIELLDTDEVALRYRLSASWLAKLRLTGEGCRFAKLGRRVLYKKADVDEWIARSMRMSTSESGETPDAP
jgi:predicted DNA-binding transcriptional regulator AlpA